jgi:hypothetical protein
MKTSLPKLALFAALSALLMGCEVQISRSANYVVEGTVRDASGNGVEIPISTGAMICISGDNFAIACEYFSSAPDGKYQVMNVEQMYIRGKKDSPEPLVMKNPKLTLLIPSGHKYPKYKLENEYHNYSSYFYEIPSRLSGYKDEGNNITIQVDFVVNARKPTSGSAINNNINIKSN